MHDGKVLRWTKNERLLVDLIGDRRSHLRESTSRFARTTMLPSTLGATRRRGADEQTGSMFSYVSRGSGSEGSLTRYANDCWLVLQ